MNAKIYSFPYQVYLVKIDSGSGRPWYTRLNARNLDHLTKRIKALYPYDYEITILGTTSDKIGW